MRKNIWEEAKIFSLTKSRRIWKNDWERSIALANFVQRLVDKGLIAYIDKEEEEEKGLKIVPK